MNPMRDIPDYVVPEGLRLVKLRDVPIGGFYGWCSRSGGRIVRTETDAFLDEPVFIEAEPPFDFARWASDNAWAIDLRPNLTPRRVARWDQIKLVAKHVEIRGPWNGRWQTAATAPARVPDDVFFEVREASRPGAVEDDESDGPRSAP